MDRFKKRLAIGSFFFILIMMAFGSHGSFNPKEIGFYTSIGAGFLSYFLTYYGFKAIKTKGTK
ncbi:hypothetical protein ADIS_4256 [Lunatimonas lonarensis]|uniref:Uncharacterized protein n=1 Tax=Lunatimonas lonarensis TaxID=1232681 RepID=R7ZLX3_9BACT|nr:hypothetical protein [Lunatimonas lonarensis]EON75085.1 hypothetical protein ADIS_4256 [Lunatimonas lonarensis]